ncbi:MAG: hypothetical protein BWX61_00605 [Bacteroidetes bacterium ADurb.Bin035]|nr:MAG: hypothetical protein BWX61_00605 [Bacteroidetes bacterium ADurb.Bin035]
MPRLDSGKYCPLPLTNFTPKAPASGCSSINAIVFAKVSFSTIVSGFSNKIYFPLAIFRA